MKKPLLVLIMAATLGGGLVDAGGKLTSSPQASRDYMRCPTLTGFTLIESLVKLKGLRIPFSEIVQLTPDHNRVEPLAQKLTLSTALLRELVALGNRPADPILATRVMLESALNRKTSRLEAARAIRANQYLLVSTCAGLPVAARLVDREPLVASYSVVASPRSAGN